MRLFLREAPRFPLQRRDSTGHCASCHPAPEFTDHSFHNTGATQVEYDAAHGPGSFAALRIPGWHERRAHPELYLPATAEHPDAAEPFRRAADPELPAYADLGVWNVFANPALPAPQPRLFARLCAEQLEERTPFRPRSLWRRCAPRKLLAASVARFGTAGLRDLSHSAPYLHSGLFDSLAEVLAFYRQASELAREARLRNPDPALAGIRLTEPEALAIVAFLSSLNEDYE